MSNEKIKNIKSEISEIKNLIAPLEEYLINNPNDLAIKLELKSFNKRLNELNIELGHITNDFGLTTFDIYLSNVGGGKIRLSNLIKASQNFQETLISCSMYDGIHPVQKKSSPTQSILDYSDPNVEIVQTNSLNIVLSVDDNQTKFDDDTPLKRGLKNFNEIISCGDDEVKLNNLMENMGVQPIFRYKKLLGVLKDNDLNLDLYHSIIPKGFETQKLSNDFAKRVYEVIDKSDAPIIEEKDFIGELYQINSKTKRCGIDVIDEDTKKTKSISIQFDDSFKEALRNKLYTEISVSVKRIIERTITDDEVNIPFDLVKIND